MDRYKLDIIKALYVIKGVCESCDTCENCPLALYDNTCVLLHYSPNHWNINDADEVWRAFK